MDNQNNFYNFEFYFLKIFSFLKFNCLKYIVFILCFVVNSLHSQIVNYITINEGLTSNASNSIYFDKNGFLWIGNEFGISRFDGVRLQNSNNSKNLNNFFLGVHFAGLDKNNNIFFILKNFKILAVDSNSQLIYRPDLIWKKNIFLSNNCKIIYKEDNEEVFKRLNQHSKLLKLIFLTSNYESYYIYQDSILFGNKKISKINYEYSDFERYTLVSDQLFFMDKFSYIIYNKNISKVINGSKKNFSDGPILSIIDKSYLNYNDSLYSLGLENNKLHLKALFKKDIYDYCWVVPNKLFEKRVFFVSKLKGIGTIQKNLFQNIQYLYKDKSFVGIYRIVEKDNKLFNWVNYFNKNNIPFINIYGNNIISDFNNNIKYIHRDMFFNVKSLNKQKFSLNNQEKVFFYDYYYSIFNRKKEFLLANEKNIDFHKGKI